MRFDGERAYQRLQELNFVRPSGSAEEARAAEMIATQLRSYGLNPTIEPFPLWVYQEKHAEVKVLAPYQEVVEASVVGLTGSTGPDGITGELVFVESGEEDFLNGIAGKIVLTYGFLRVKKYERLVKAKAKAVICIGEPGKDLMHLCIRETCLKRFGELPAVGIRYEDALKLLKAKAKEVSVICEQEQHEGESRNVVVDIPGTTGEEIVALCAHYDTVPYTTGSTDNTGGSATLLELARIFAKQPPKRTLRFIWCGSEEVGLVGSINYLKQHEDQIERIKLLVNIDVAGGIIGRNVCIVTGAESLRAYAAALSKELGCGMNTELGISSSDSLPFGDKGIPSLNIARYGGATTYLHTCDDAIEHIDAPHLAMLGEYAEVFIERIANARVFPFEKEISDQCKQDIAKYNEESQGMKPKKKDEK